MTNAELLLPPEVARLARAIRFALVCLIVALSYFTIRATSAVPAFEQVFRDMLNGKPLPALTMFVIHFQYVLLACAWMIPLVALGTLFSRQVIASFYLIGGLCLLVVALFLFMYQALSTPFLSIVQQMQGG